MYGKQPGETATGLLFKVMPPGIISILLSSCEAGFEAKEIEPWLRAMKPGVA